MFIVNATIVYYSVFRAYRRQGIMQGLADQAAGAVFAQFWVWYVW